MEKVEQRQQTRFIPVHVFYCNDCGKEIGRSEEHDDGWFKVHGKFEIDVYLPFVGKMTLESCLCDSCARHKSYELSRGFETLGFKQNCE